MATSWIWSRNTDLAAFGGSALLALGLAAASGQLTADGALPPWAWIVFVLMLDVAHVWSTLFRTYLDPEEVAKRRGLYLGLPVACYLFGVALHVYSATTFWRVLAYVAVFHFVRQQVGWVAIYRARASERDPLGRWLDHGLIYAATGWPLLWWHANLPRQFSWFMDGDFIDLSLLRPLVAPAAVLYGALAVGYVVRSIQRYRRSGSLNLGKHLVVSTTALIWYVGIVAIDEDFTFTVTNVTIHGVPYLVLLWSYARERSIERPGSLMTRIVGFGVGGFWAVALAFAFCEELLWDQLVWHERPTLFGAGGVEPSASVLSLVVPLLALPQLVHYALDGVLWRGRDAGAAQARALGFAARTA